MKINIVSILLLMVFCAMFEESEAQKMGFISSNTIREKFDEVKSAEQRVQSIVEGWKRESDAIQQQIEALEFDIKKNRLIWTDSEKFQNDQKLTELKKKQSDFNSTKYKPNGEYDQTVKMIMMPIEKKIYAAVQETAAEEKVDIVWDQSIQPMPYVNFKFDLTLKVLRRLGINVEDLEKDLQTKIDKDPRNQKREPRNAPRARSRTAQQKEEGADEKKPRSRRSRNVERETPSENEVAPPDPLEEEE